VFGRILSADKPPHFYLNLIALTCKWFTTITVIVLILLKVQQSSFLLITFLVAYNSVLSFYLLKCIPGFRHKLLLLALDFSICISLLSISGGWASPYFQYGLNFLVFSALFFHFWGAAIATAIYGASYYIVLYLNGFNLNRIISNGYFESFITDYAIFIAVGISSAFIFKVLNSLDFNRPIPGGAAPEENPTIEELDALLSLTLQEIKVASLLVDGLSNKQIASELDISINTVKFHTGNIYRKLGVKDRPQAIIKLLDYPALAPLDHDSISKDKTPRK